MGFALGLSLNQTITFLVSSFPASSSHTPTTHSHYFPSTATISHHHHHHLFNLPRTSSSQDIPIELAQESKFVPLNSEDPQFGPPALLLLGLEYEEIVKIQDLLKDLDGEFIQIVCCTEDMITCSLWDAVTTKQPNLQEVKIAKSLPRICFLSGLTGEEMMMFIDAFPETGLEPAVFAALVPNSADKPVEELIDEIMGDHELITSRNK